MAAANGDAPPPKKARAGPLAGGRVVLNIPGPTEIPEEVLGAMHRQPVALASKSLDELLASVVADLRPLFGCGPDAEIFLHAANGHGMWDAILTNTLRPGDVVLHSASGLFAESWGDSAAALGLVPESLPGGFAEAMDPERLRGRLRQDTGRRIRAVLAVQVDTASGVVSDVAALGRALRDAGHDALLLVDAVASFAVQPMKMQEWGVDGVITACQKGLMCPPGLGILCAGPRALEWHKAAKRPAEGLSSRYWDWTFRQPDWHYWKFCGTMPEHLIFALRKALDLIHAEGLEHALARQRHCAEAVRRAVAAWAGGSGGAVRFLVEDPKARSDAVTVMLIADEYEPRSLVEFCERNFDVILGNTIGDMTARVGCAGLRFATMGHVGLPQVLAVLGAVEAAFVARGVPHGAGGLQAAARYFGEVAAAAAAAAAA